jgi:anti-sigma factor RsiW
MTNREHERAIDLIMRRGPEELATADLGWLEAHLETCPACAQYDADFNHTGRLLRATAITASPALVMKTQLRVRERAMYLREQRTRTVLIAISFCLGAMSSAMSAWLWWRFGAWVAARFGWSPALVEPGIMLALLLPAIVIAGLMLAFPHTVNEGALVTALSRERAGEIR